MPWPPPAVITYRELKGSDITAAEYDGTILALYNMITDKAVQGVGIASVELLGNNQLVFQLTDHTYLPAITLPTATFAFAGQWMPDTAYYVNDIITEAGSVYQVLFNHMSGSSFDPNANDGMGHNYYGLWIQSGFYISPVQMQTGVAWTPALSDAQTYNRFTNGSMIVVTIPPNASVAFSIGTEIKIRQAGVGTIFFEGESGVMLNPQDSCLNNTSGQGATVTLTKVDTDEWDLSGRLEVHA